MSHISFIAPIDGHWSRWSRFTACSTSCGIGFHRRVRLCNDPHPAYGGNECVGESWELKNCRIRLCKLGKHVCVFLRPLRLSLDKVVFYNKLSWFVSELPEKDISKVVVQCR